MQKLFILDAIYIALAFLALVTMRVLTRQLFEKWGRTLKGPPKYKSKALLTQTEHRFFLRLVQALPNRLVVPQVAMGAIVQVTAAQNKGKDGWRYRSAFSQKILDFVVYDSATNRIVCVIELDDKSHDSAAAQKRDDVKNSVLKQAGYTLYRFDARAMPTTAQLKQVLPA